MDDGRPNSAMYRYALNTSSVRTRPSRLVVSLIALNDICSTASLLRLGTSV
jgi:hypothetical protein